MKTLKTILLIAFTITLFSCNKDSGEIIELPKQESTGLKNYTIDGVPFNMTYNDDNLLIKYQYGNTHSVTALIDYNPNGSIAKNGSRAFKYNSQGQIATITENLSPTALFVSTMVHNSQGLVESITTNHNNGQTGTIKINYNSKNKPVLISENNPAVTSPYSKTTLTYNDLGNVTKKFIERSNDGISYYDFSTNTYTYDDKKNPFALTINKIGNSNNQLFHGFIGMNSVSFGRQVAFAEFYFNSPNNLLSNQDSFKIISYSYTYNDDGYPITRKEIYDASSSGGNIYNYDSTFTYEKNIN